MGMWWPRLPVNHLFPLKASLSWKTPAAFQIATGPCLGHKRIASAQRSNSHEGQVGRCWAGGHSKVKTGTGGNLDESGGRGADGKGVSGGFRALSSTGCWRTGCDQVCLGVER